MAVRVGEFVVVRELGAGSFAVVYEAHDAAGATVALKVLPLARMDDRTRASVCAEIRVHTRLVHENIVAMRAVQRSARYVFCVLEFCDGGDLAGFLRAHGPLSESDARVVSVSVRDGMRYLHARSVMHRDIKPSNVLLARKPVSAGSPSSSDVRAFTFKLADFGFARVLGVSELAHTLCGSPLYMAPELLAGDRYDASADLYSIGVLLVEMLTGHVPFTGRSPMELLSAIRSSAWARETEPPQEIGNEYDCGGILPRHIALKISPSLKLLLWALLRAQPSARMTFDEFFAYPWLQPEAPTAAAPASGNATQEISATTVMPSSAAELWGFGASGAAPPLRPPPRSTIVAPTLADGRTVPNDDVDDYYVLEDDVVSQLRAIKAHPTQKPIAHTHAASARPPAASPHVTPIEQPNPTLLAAATDTLKGRVMLQQAAALLDAVRKPMSLDDALARSHDRLRAATTGSEISSDTDTAWAVVRAGLNVAASAAGRSLRGLELEALAQQVVLRTAERVSELVSAARTALERARQLLASARGIDDTPAVPSDLTASMFAGSLSYAVLESAPTLSSTDVRFEVVARELVATHASARVWLAAAEDEARKAARMQIAISGVQ